MSFASMLQGLTAARVRFVVVGGVAAAAHGSSHVTNDLDICYDVGPDNIERLAALLAEWDAYPRGVERGLPFFMDERQLRTTPLMTLTTREGDLDVLDRVAGVGGFAHALESSVEFEAFGVRFPVLDLPDLIRAKRAAGRAKDIAQLPELEALVALRRRTR
jgi:predicted nucleotidyltransferase